jgi:hypothetical protein
MASKLMGSTPHAMQFKTAIPLTSQGRARSLGVDVHPGDLWAHFDHASPGEISVCAAAAGDWHAERALELSIEHEKELPGRCQTVNGEATQVELAVPLQPRID